MSDVKLAAPLELETHQLKPPQKQISPWWLSGVALALQAAAEPQGHRGAAQLGPFCHGQTEETKVPHFGSCMLK